MNNKKIYIFFSLIVVVGILSLKLLPQEESTPRSDNGLRIGAGDDITGILLSETIGLYENSPDKPVITSESDFFMDDYSFKDC